MAHARFLRIKKELISTQVEQPQNHTPAVVNQPVPNPVRYDPCKFDIISIAETKEENGKIEIIKTEVFNQGTKPEDVSYPQNYLTRIIYFDFDSFAINAQANTILNHILSFILMYEGTNIVISGYACVIGRQNYNRGLSQRRSDAVCNFFTSGGVDPRRITSRGYGEIDPSDDKKGRDNIKYKDEKEYQESRKVTISFTYMGHDAASILYQTVAPGADVDIKKKLTVEIQKFDTKECIREKDKHQQKFKMIDIGQEVDNGDKSTTHVSPAVIEVYSDLSGRNVLPIWYIWPMATTPNKFWLYIHSCRYYSNYNNPTVKIEVFPDIKWTLKFFLNLTNDLSVEWQNLDAKEHKDWQKKAGKIGAEKRWEQKDVSFGFSLKAKWNNNKREEELKYKYESKFKKMYDIFASIGAMADGITNKTKGCSPKGIPATFAVKPPNIDLSGDWFLAHPKDNKTILGTNVKIALKATPLIGLEITIDLLGTLIFTVSGLISGGTAAKGVTELYQRIQGVLKKGINAGNDDLGIKGSVDIYMDLIITQTINFETDFTFNTAGKKKDSQLKIEGNSKLKVELKAGIKVQGELVVIIVTAQGYFEAFASGETSITFGHTINYDEKGLYYRPELGFDGLNAKYLVEISAGLAIKIVKNKHNIENNKKYTLAEGNYSNVIPPFDVIKELEQLFGISANIPLIKNDDDNNLNN